MISDAPIAMDVAAAANSVFGCDERDCLYITTAQLQLDQHKTEIHARRRCTLCDDFATSYDSEMKEHLRVVHRADFGGGQGTKVMRETKDLQKSNGLDANRAISEEVEIEEVRNEQGCLVHSCKRCQYSKANKMMVVRHFRAVHLKIKEFKCSECAYESAYKQQLQLHEEKMHGPGSSTQQPKMGKSDGAVLSKKRERMEPDPADLEPEVIIRSEAANAGPDSKLISCDRCNYASSQRHCVLRHIKSVHDNIKDHVCSECGRAFADPSNFRGHMRRHHGIELPRKRRRMTAPEGASLPKETDPEKMFTCDTCPFSTASKATLRSHVYNVHRNRDPLPCQETDCSFLASSKRELNFHVKSVHEGLEVFACGWCDSKFTNLHSHKLHVKKQHPDKAEKAWKCDHCEDFETDSKADFRAHVKSHRLQRCDACDYRASKKTLLRAHVLKFHEDRSEPLLTCDQCGDFVTPSKARLFIHKKVAHEGAERHTCHNCGFETLSAPALARHVRKKHLVGGRFDCKQCDYRPRSEKGLETHIRRVHAPKREKKEKVVRAPNPRAPKAHRYVV